MGFLNFMAKFSKATKDKPSPNMAAKVARGEHVGERRTSQLVKAAARAMQVREAVESTRSSTSAVQQLPMGSLLPIARRVAAAQRLSYQAIEGKTPATARELTKALTTTHGRKLRPDRVVLPTKPLSVPPDPTAALERQRQRRERESSHPIPIAHRPGSIADTAERFRKWRQQRAMASQDERNLRTPIRDRIKDLSWGDRRQRLEAGGSLLSAAAVAERTLVPKPNLRQIIAESEGQEEAVRQDTLRRRLTGKRGGGLRGMAGRVGARFGLGSAAGAGGALGAVGVTGGVVVGAAALAVAFANLGSTIERFSTGILESSRSLAKFSPAIANTFARLEWQNVQLQAQMARNTSGTATELGEKVGVLRGSVQPQKEAFVTLKNLVAEGAAIFAKEAHEILVAPLLQPLVDFARYAELLAGKSEETGWPMANIMDQIAANDWAARGPANKEPGGNDDAVEAPAAGGMFPGGAANRALRMMK